MDLTARVEAVDAAACNLVGTSEVSMSGKAGGLRRPHDEPVADQVLKQFAANFAAQVQAMQAQRWRRSRSAPAGRRRQPAPPAQRPGPDVGRLQDWLRRCSR